MLRDDDEHPHKAYVVHDHELPSILRVARQEGSTLSETLRKAFDGEPLENRTRQHGELDRHRLLPRRPRLDHRRRAPPAARRDVDRERARQSLLWLWSELVTTLPFGGVIDQERLAAIADRIAEGIAAVLDADYPVKPSTAISPRVGVVLPPAPARHRRGSRARADDPAPRPRRPPRHRLRRPRRRPGTSPRARRGGDRLVRLQPRHRRAAVRRAAIGDTAKLLEAIRQAGDDGLDGTAQSAVFHRHRSAEQLDSMRADLERRQLIHTVDVPTGGRPRLVSFAVSTVGGTHAK